MTWSADDYVDVAERIRGFKKEFPEGSLQSFQPPYVADVGERSFVIYSAAAYRTPDDPRPGVGWAWEPVPGPTPFTRDSELQNAETSAWGRAIVALGFETKHIASANEVLSRTESPQTARPAIKIDSEEPVSKAQHAKLAVVLKRLGESEEPVPGGLPDWTAYAKQWIVEKYGKQSRADLTKTEMSALIEELDGMAVPF